MSLVWVMMVCFSYILNREKCMFFAPFSGSFIIGCCKPTARYREGNTLSERASNLIEARNGPFSNYALQALDLTRCDSFCRGSNDTNSVDVLMRASFKFLELGIHCTTGFYTGVTVVPRRLSSVIMANCNVWTRNSERVKSQSVWNVSQFKRTLVRNTTCHQSQRWWFLQPTVGTITCK